MSSMRILVGTIWIAILLVTHGIWNATALPINHPEAIAGDESAAVSEFNESRVEPSDVPKTRQVDIYGNEVEAAISDYRIDSRGDLYEHHHPQTALPEPSRPST